MKALKSLTSLGPRYTALWVGQTISQFGTYVAFLTLPFLVNYLQDLAGEESTLDFAFTYALEVLPTFLVGLAGGVLLDRWQLRPIMVVSDLLRACAFFYLAANLGNYGISTVLVVAFVIGSFTTMFDGAMFSLIPLLVKEEDLVSANGFVVVSQQANFALGPLAAGLFVTLSGSPRLGLFINGLSFALSALSLLWVGRVAHRTDPASVRHSFLTEAANGIRYIWAERRLRITTLAAAVINFVIGFVEATFVVLAALVLGTTSGSQVGILVFAMGVGGVVGAAFAPRLTRRFGLGRTLAMGTLVTGLGMFALMYTSYGPLALALQFGWMFGVSVINIPLATIRQHYAVESMTGRVISASRAIGWATLPFGALIGGWLGDSPDTYPIVARAFPLLLVATALALFFTVVWRDTFGPGFDKAENSDPFSPTVDANVY